MTTRDLEETTKFKALPLSPTELLGTPGGQVQRAVLGYLGLGKTTRISNSTFAVQDPWLKKTELRPAQVVKIK